MFAKRFFNAGMNKVILTGAGIDRVGIVRDLTGMIFDLDGNIADSRMTKLEQNFALMMLVEIPERNFKSFQEKVKLSRESFAIHLDVSSLDSEVSMPVEPQDYKAVIEMVGDDQPGLVYNLTQHLASIGANINNIDTYSYAAPMCGTPLFKIKAKVTLSSMVEFEKFKQGLKPLESTLAVEVDAYRDEDVSDSSDSSY